MMTGSPNSSSASIPLFSSGASTPISTPSNIRKRSDGSSELLHSNISGSTPGEEPYFTPQWGHHFYSIPQKRNQGTASSKKRVDKGDMPVFKDGRVRKTSMFHVFDEYE